MSQAETFEVVLVGGGLSQGLIALRLAALRPEVRFVMLEAGAQLGGNHTWSFHGTDVAPDVLAWLKPLISKSWGSHDVAFGQSVRRIGGGYHSVKSDDFHEVLMRQLGSRVRLSTRVETVTRNAVTLAGGEVVRGGCVLDGRGFAAAPDWPSGFQKFFGMEVELTSAHGLDAPLIMDTRVDQLDGFRFVYLLPWSETRVLVEDTVYSDTPTLSADSFQARIVEYLKGRGLSIKQVERIETATLPIPLSGESPRPEVPSVGVAGGFFHATTGYSLPVAAELADALAALPSLDSTAVGAWLSRRAQKQWADGRFFRLLNRMLFIAAGPAERLRIFSTFYRNSDALIARFYAGRLSSADILSILARGSTTLPLFAATRAALSLQAKPVHREA